MKLRSLISQRIYEKHLLYFIAFCFGFGLAGLEFVLEWLVPKKESAYDKVKKKSSTEPGQLVSASLA
jgi:hypothetical protein